MSNARNLANLLGTNTAVPSSKLTVASSNLPAGSVIQVVQGTLGTTVTKSPADGLSEDSGLSASITPSSTSSKILVEYSVFLGQAASYNAFTRILRGSTVIGNGTLEGTRPVGNAMVTGYAGSGSDTYWVGCASNSFLDSPATTSATTYKIQIGAYNGYNVYLNRSHSFQDDTDDGYDTIPLSTITLTEIAG